MRTQWWKNPWVVVPAAAIVTVAIAYVLFLFFRADDDDRPPIVVRNGSAAFDGGTPTKSKPWKKKNASDAGRWGPNHPNGKSVTTFTVTISGSDTPGVCSTLAITGTEVAIEYTVKSTSAVTTVRVIRDLILSTPGTQKWEPLVTAPADMAPVVTPGGTPPRIVYDPGAGWISKATVTSASGSTSCGFPEPATGDAGAIITIQPNG